MSEQKKQQIARYETMDDAWKDFETSVLRPAARERVELSEETLAFLRECFYAGAIGFRSIYYTCMAENSFPGVLKLNSMLDSELEKIVKNRHLKSREKKESVH